MLAGQADVEDRQAGSLPVDGRQPDVAVGRLDDPEPLPAQVQVDQVGDVGVVLHHHDRARFGCSRWLSLTPRWHRSVRSLVGDAPALSRLRLRHGHLPRPDPGRPPGRGRGRRRRPLVGLVAGGRGPTDGASVPPGGLAAALTGSGGRAWRSSPRSSGGRRPRATSAPDLVAERAGQGVRRRRGGVPVGADRPGVLRRLGRGPGRGPRRVRPARAAQGFHRLRQADVCDARLDGRRRRAADRGRPVRRRAGRAGRPGRRARPRRPGRGARRGRGRGGARRRRHADRGQPARPGHLRGRHPTGPSGWRRPCPPA